MSAVLPASVGRMLAEFHPPVQPGLIGIEAAPVVPEIKFSLVGQLHRMAEVRISPDGKHAHLIVEIVQPPHGGHSRMPVVAVYHAHESEVLTLQTLARQMVTGSLVLLICRGLDMDVQRHELRAWRCDRITAIAPIEAAQYLPDEQLECAEPHMEQRS